MTKACHTTVFFNLVLRDLKEAPAWDEAEFLAGLALLCVEAMSQRQRITPAADHDLQAKVWTAVANTRRRAAEWEKAHQALSNAERHRKEGMGDPLGRHLVAKSIQELLNAHWKHPAATVPGFR